MEINLNAVYLNAKGVDIFSIRKIDREIWDTYSYQKKAGDENFEDSLSVDNVFVHHTSIFVDVKVLF